MAIKNMLAPYCERCGEPHNGACEPRFPPTAQPAPEQRTGRSKRDRIRRLRERLKLARDANPDDPIIGILAGLLDLLEDEL